MNEFAVSWLKGDEMAEVDAPSGSALKSKLLKLAKERPSEVTNVTENKDGSLFCKVPVSWVKISPKKKVSEETRKAASERLKKYQEEKRVNDDSE